LASVNWPLALSSRKVTPCTLPAPSCATSGVAVIDDVGTAVTVAPAGDGLAAATTLDAAFGVGTRLTGTAAEDVAAGEDVAPGLAAGLVVTDPVATGVTA
jgi:hypothetical protein